MYSLIYSIGHNDWGCGMGKKLILNLGGEVFQYGIDKIESDDD
jgi:hypothetical protein